MDVIVISGFSHLFAERHMPLARTIHEMLKDWPGRPSVFHE